MDRPRIDAIRIEHIHDTDPNLSHLGHYSDKPGPDDKTVDRYPDGKYRANHQYRYFIAAMSGKETGNPDSVEQDYQRMEAYHRGEWHMIGVRAVADVSYAFGVAPTSRRIQRFESGGLWGVESDSGDEHLTSVARNELADLKEHLEHFGVDVSNFDEMATAAIAAPATR